MQAEVGLVQPAVAERVVLQGLTIQLGPDLRTTYPVVMNFNISGRVDITGPADASKLQLQGTIKLDSGEVSPPLLCVCVHACVCVYVCMFDSLGLKPRLLCPCVLTEICFNGLHLLLSLHSSSQDLHPEFKS